MNLIFKPNLAKRHPDRYLNCQEALHLAFQDLCDQAIDAGWEPDEVATALLEIADAHVLTMAENAKLDALLTSLKRQPR